MEDGTLYSAVSERCRRRNGGSHDAGRDGGARGCASRAAGCGGSHEQLSRQIIADALARSGGVKQKAAELLKVHRKTLYNQMKKLGIE